MSKSRRAVFVHIGAPKTGTTQLQKYLFDNRAALLARGITYPDVSLRGYGHHDVAFLLSGGYPEWATPQDRSLEELTSQLATIVDTGNENILISSENFFLFPAPEALHVWLTNAGLRCPEDISIIVYLRRQDLAIESWYNQTVKAQGSTQTFLDSVDQWHDLWDYRRQLASWSSVFGRGAMIVRVYEDQQFANGSLILDFIEQLGIDPLDTPIPTERINSGLNRTILEFQRLINQLPLTIMEKRTFHRQLIALTKHTAGAQLFNETPLLDTLGRNSILKDYAASNSAVAHDYFDRSSLFFDQVPEGIAGSATPPALSNETLVYIIGWLLIQSDKTGKLDHAAQ